MRRSVNILTATLLSVGIATGCGGGEKYRKGPVKVTNILNVPVYIGDTPRGGNPWPYRDEPNYLTIKDPRRRGEIEPGKTAVASCIASSGIDTVLFVRNRDGERGYVKTHSDGTRTGGPVQQIEPSAEELEARLPRCQTRSD